MDDRALKILRKDARALAREIATAFRRRGSRLPAPARSAVETRLRELDLALAESADAKRLGSAVQALRAEASRHPALRRATTREYIESLAMAVGVALLIRAFIIEAFKIPTGSMIPTLMIDDHLFVNKFTYGLRIPFTHTRILDLGQPERGDIAVFEFPGEGEDHGKDFIKRIVAVPGDRVRLEDNRLVINGETVPTDVVDPATTCSDATFAGCRCVRQRERLGDQEFQTQHLAPPPVNTSPACVNSPDWPSDDPRQFGPHDAPGTPSAVVVPAGHVLGMGDNRDNSSDGRYWGFIPIENLKGRALFTWWPPGRWFHVVH